MSYQETLEDIRRRQEQKQEETMGQEAATLFLANPGMALRDCVIAAMDAQRPDGVEREVMERISNHAVLACLDGIATKSVATKSVAASEPGAGKCVKRFSRTRALALMAGFFYALALFWISYSKLWKEGGDDEAIGFVSTEFPVEHAQWHDPTRDVW